MVNFPRNVYRNPDIFVHHNRMLRSNLKIINSLLKNLDLEVLADSVRAALWASEIDRRLTTSIQELFDNTLKWENARFELDEIPDGHMKLLRWLLTWYRSIRGWNKLARTVERKVRLVTMMCEEWPPEVISPAEIQKLQDRLEYYLVMMQEPVFFDSSGGPPLESEERDSEGKIKGRKACFSKCITYAKSFATSVGY